ncbi:group 1 truncated hemoglobin [Paenibacillus sp. MSJ-34]|uniref:group I truncated hemoglobin n=1 Tax=Paenibacillus sp. MSJ-34 TaxID=2841529 RepID=UPI001C112996|nr:group 1 truncated hemoglobin [Paenibacillus sp. MSJ-34]MBU5445103.1 group 1 truncated hemoglobin [Paenibacillus sp. MSJ-34]
MTSTATLYEQLGGEETIGKVVDYFYELVLADDTVNHFFANTDMEKQRLHQTKFISFALGGPKRYTGKAMAKAHEGMNLQPEHFDAIVKHLREALEHFEVPEANIREALDKIATLKDDVLYK